MTPCRLRTFAPLILMCVAFASAACGAGGGDDDDDELVSDDDATGDDDDDAAIDAASDEWTDTGVDANAGDTLRIEATGEADLGAGGGSVGPDGDGACGLGCPMPDAARGALVGRIAEGTPFFVGASFDDVLSTAGRLSLIVNDDSYSDNGGGFDVTIEVIPGDGGDLPASCRPENFAIQVVEVVYGVLAGFGQNDFPDNVLGPPAGLGAFAPQAAPGEMLSLGEGGSITLKMGREIIDGDGPDFAVFENLLYWGGEVTNAYTEAAVVEVSEDGETWTRFPFDFIADGPIGPLGVPDTVPDNFLGFAGIAPSNANCDPNGDGSYDDMIDPLDPVISGGDLFDLADIGVASARYVRIVDTGHLERAPGTETYDDDGDLVTDGGNLLPAYEGIQGFDLDAIAVINGGEELEIDA
ncbi:MAG: hypothetical protein KJ042_08315 [Deltaproteobacteria bacterium]|nr:hypothetical protein [Deltaproteobacteria bacterium]